MILSLLDTEKLSLRGFGMKKNIIQLILVHRAINDVGVYKNWDKFQLFVVEGCIEFVIDGIEVHIREEVTLEIKNIYPDDNIKNYVTVTFNAPDRYLCKVVENGDIRQDREENACNAFMLIKSFMLPPGTYY